MSLSYLLRNNRVFKFIKIKLLNRGSIALYPILIKFILVDRFKVFLLSFLIKIVRSRFLIGLIEEIEISRKNVFLHLQNNILLYLPTDRIDSLNGIISGVFESYETKIMRKIMKRGDVVLDIGASFGYYSILFSKWVGKNGRVFAFEPLPWALKLLEKNITMNNAKSNINVSKFALGNKKGKVLIFDYKWADSGFSSLKKHGLMPASQTGCKIITLDEYVKSKKEIKKIDFIKCDVEGAELLVLKGATEVLKKFSPAIVFEVLKAYHRDFNYQPEDLYDYLISLKYKIYEITRDELRLINKKESKNMWGYYLALKGNK